MIPLNEIDLGGENRGKKLFSFTSSDKAANSPNRNREQPLENVTFINGYIKCDVSYLSYRFHPCDITSMYSRKLYLR